MTFLTLHQDEHVPTPDGMPEWLKLIVPIAMAAIVAYYTSVIKSESSLSRIDATQEARYVELRNAIEALRYDIREMRRVTR
jgi:hypothetical protein